MKFVAYALTVMLILGAQLSVFAQEEIPKEPPIEQEAVEKSEAVTQADIKALVKELGSDDWQARDKAMERLVEIGEPALSAVAAARDSDDFEVKTRAEKILDALNWISPEDCKKIDELVKSYAVEDKKRADTDEEDEAKKKAVRRLIDEMKKIKLSGFYLIKKLRPSEESDKKLVAEILGGLLNLTYWTGADGYHIAGNKIVMDDGEEIPMPAGPWRIEEKGDKVFINGMELQLPTKIEKEIPPVAVLGKIVGGCQGSFKLKLEGLKILEEMKDKEAVQYVMHALKTKLNPEDEETIKLQHQILTTLSKIEKDGPSYEGDGKDIEKLQTGTASWKKWWRKARKEEPYNK